MTDRDKQVAENIKRLLPRLSDQDKAVFLAYGEGMACKAAHMTCDSVPAQQRQK